MFDIVKFPTRIQNTVILPLIISS